MDDPGQLVDRIAASGVTVGLTAGAVPVPGFAPPAAIARRMPGIIANTRRLSEAGARLAVGTDAGIRPPEPHGVLPYALQQAAAIGLTPPVALRLATSGAAAVCGLSGSKGRLAPGFDADVVAVDGDPLTDLAALHRVRAVFARGRAIT